MFARKRQVDPIDAPAAEVEAPGVITGPAAKLMSMLGLSPEALAQTAGEVKAMLDDFRARLDRIEAKLDRLNAIVDHGWQNAPDPSHARRAHTRVDNEKRANGTG